MRGGKLEMQEVGKEEGRGGGGFGWRIHEHAVPDWCFLGWLVLAMMR